MKLGIIGLGVVGKANAKGFELKKHKVFLHDIKFNSKIENLVNTDINFVCVPTPSKKNGSCNTDIVESIIKELTKINYKGIIAIRSTVEPTFTERMIKKYKNSNICFVPEFLKERSAKIFASS